MIARVYFFKAIRRMGYSDLKLAELAAAGCNQRGFYKHTLDGLFGASINYHSCNLLGVRSKSK